MNLDLEKRYNRDFLSWDEKKILSLKKSKQFIPKFHIYPTTGLLNDPNCVFYHNGIFNIMFQHHLANPIHGLKTMSLAQTKDFSKFNYKFMVNKPTNNFESHGIYTGNALKINNQILCLYTGNSRDENWIRTSYVVVSFFDPIKKEFVDKKPILNNFDYQKYTEHFRDPYVFKHGKKFFFLLGAQTKKQEGVILLFELDQNFDKAKLIKEFWISKKYRMIECPNLALIHDKVVLIYSPQYKQDFLPKNENPDIVRYLILDKNNFFDANKEEVIINDKQEQILDYGLEFYAPQTFLKNKKWCIIAWSGIPTSNNYPESKNGWVFVLSMVKELSLKNDKLILKELKSFKNNFRKKQAGIFYEKIKLNENEAYIIEDQKSSNLTLKFQNNKLTIKRYNDKNYFPYNSKKTITLNNQSVDLEIFFDVSIIEIKINNNYWYTSRLYLDQEVRARRIYD